MDDMGMVMMLNNAYLVRCLSYSALARDKSFPGVVT